MYYYQCCIFADNECPFMTNTSIYHAGFGPCTVTCTLRLHGVLQEERCSEHKHSIDLIRKEMPEFHHFITTCTDNICSLCWLSHLGLGAVWGNSHLDLKTCLNDWLVRSRESFVIWVWTCGYFPSMVHACVHLHLLYVALQFCLLCKSMYCPVQ